MLLRREALMVGLALALALTGCAPPEAGEGGRGIRPHERRKLAPPTARVVGIARRIRPAHEERWMDEWVDVRATTRAGIPIPLGTEIIVQDDMLVHVSNPSCGQDFWALIGPDPNQTGAASFEVHESIGVVRIHFGWMVAIGALPAGETETSGTSSSGTQLVIRAESAIHRDTIYHLPEPKIPSDPNRPDPNCTVHAVDINGARVATLPPGTFLVYTVGAHPPVQPLPTSDAFLDFVAGRARLAGQALNWPPVATGVTGGSNPP